jgi:hypothetical protein
VAVAAHVTVALPFLLKPRPDDDFGIDASPELDREALARLARAQAVPRPSEHALNDELSYIIPVRFNIR